MKWEHFIAGFLLIHGGMLGAQDHGEPRTYHFLGYEPGHIQLKESNLIPKVFSGLAHTLTYGFERAGETLHSFQFAFIHNNPKTDIERDYVGGEDHTKINGQFHFQYSYDPVHLSRRGVHLYLGPRLSYTYSLSYLHGWDSHAYWGNYLSLGSSSVVRVDLRNDRAWQTTLNLSLAGLYARPDLIRRYKTEDWSVSHILKITNRRYSVGLWDNAFQIQISTEYRLPIRGRRFLALGLASYYSRIKREEGRPLREVIHRIVARILL